MFNLGLLDYPVGQCSNMLQRKNSSTEKILCDNEMAIMLDRINGQTKMMFQCLWACQFGRKPLSKMKCLPMQIMKVISRKMSEMQGNQVLMLPHTTSNQDQEVHLEQEWIQPAGAHWIRNYGSLSPFEIYIPSLLISTEYKEINCDFKFRILFHWLRVCKSLTDKAKSISSVEVPPS